MGDNKIANRKVYVYIDGTQVEKSVNGINEQLRKVRAEQRKLTIGSDEYVASGKKIAQLEKIIQEHRNSLKKTGKSWQSLNNISEGFNKYFGVLTAVIASLTGVTFAIRKAIESFAALEEKEADVRKYTGMTKEEVKDLNKSFKEIDTRTGREQLNDLAADAGRLGIKGKQDILDFVQAADIINVSLGEDLGKDATKNIGKLAQMFGASGATIKESMLAVGSAINDVAQNSSASEPYLVNFSARLAGTGKQAKISIGDLIGFGSVLDQNMQNAEMSATALQSVILKMYQEPAKFAKMAGKDVKEFTDLMKTDANEAVMTLLTSLRDTGGLEKLAPIFKEMKLDGVQASGVINTLAGNIDNIRKEQETANSAFEKGTSVINEFDVKNNTLQATIDKANKSLTEMSYELGEKLAPYMIDCIAVGEKMIKAFSVLVGFIISNTKGIILLAVAVGSYITYLKLAILWENRAVIGKAALTKANILLKGSILLLEIAYYRLTGQMGKYQLSMYRLSVITKINPYALLTAAVITLIAGITMYVLKLKETISLEQRLSSLRKQATKSTLDQRIELDLLLKTAKNEKLSLEQRKIAMDKINTISPEFLGNLKLEEINTNKATIARDKYIASLQRTVMAEIAHDKIKGSSPL